MGSLALNWKMVGAYAAAWLLTFAGLAKGTRVIGWLSYVTATAPYLIMLVLFGRAVFLQDAYEGMRFYLLEPDMSAVYSPQVSGGASRWGG